MSIVPEHDRDFVRRLLIVLAIVAVAVLVPLVAWAAVEVSLLLFAGILWGIFLAGLTEWVRRLTHLSYGWSLAVLLLAFLAVLAGLGFWLGPQIADAAVQAADRLSGAWESVARSLQQQDWVRHLQQQFPSVPAFLKSTGSTLSAFVGSLFTGAVNAVVGFLVVLFVGIYLAVDPDVYRQGLVSLVPPARRERARQVLDRLQTVLWRWILGQLSSMAIIGICTVIGMWALGLPIPITLGLISGTLTFIPNFGPILSAVPQVLLALTQSPMLAVYVLAFHTGLQFIESYFVTPLIQQHQVRLPAVMIIMAQVLMGALTGILGLIFATPLFAAGMVLVKELYLRDVLGDDDAARFEGIDP